MEKRHTFSLSVESRDFLLKLRLGKTFLDRLGSRRTLREGVLKSFIFEVGLNIRRVVTSIFLDDRLNTEHFRMYVINNLSIEEGEIGNRECLHD